MIGYLKGTVKDILEGDILINCSGVGYRVQVGGMTFCIDEEIELYIYTHVRENELKLFGFKKVKELLLFEMLIDVSGVGPKAAISLISQLGAKIVTNCILQKDAKGMKVSGVGIKTADKIILELFDKLKKKGYCFSRSNKKDILKDKRIGIKLEEAGRALESLGYSSYDIKKCISNIEYNKSILNMSIEDLVKYLLSEIK